MLAGGSGRIYTIYDASHRLRPDGAVRRNVGSTLRLRERAARWPGSSHAVGSLRRWPTATAHPGPQPVLRPGVEATANLLADLCESLAEEYDVTVVTGRLQGRAELPSDEVLNGVRVLRTRSTAFDRTKLRFRALNYVTYLAGQLRPGASRSRARTSCSA